MLSLGVGARLDSILQIVCFRTSDVSIDNLVYFFHNLTQIVWYSEASIGKNKLIYRIKNKIVY